ncbi:uncharacterized protein OCT59_002641 [Rhizophagus irregularis]|uniref:Uncharacterized protein n=5 Tax=Rhizophagus irregularis TaxID=588596 RepID=A0A015I8T6_RHIIW|nr:hypothetical protein GLOIN_2v1840459 [Rhizophagus irregularis DAOM 181602=DAOM 197198]EXX50195.1 hypothetical protein RirG_273130 [Rhizophagus irregularis DAOM 197198w]UZO11067.1 hypothetical protein OCT59_002641 [Rhizophagus irregularis]POG72588.1 hypothetical protein GLOIN_2v1840459 [Rhizophagus irregularis DAOM 181602=DAOM 197198]CAB4396535.1 unnamed protein product [Rhizophagus irregularis]CAG8616070.1 13733_t:CDS:2 [Rhizophagus irregularis]|eukprot:XP_025179454.1 hypothetical protein GLOIN_2v1840459 [Rhizophagus irregularis DAOM 181602=DAOM 197198]
MSITGNPYVFIGFVNMVGLHNFVKSVLLYRAGREKYLTMLKVIFNASITAYYLIELLYVTNDLSLDECKKISYAQIIFGYLMVQSLAAYMFNLIKQYEYNKFDTWMSIGLLVLRAGFHIAYIFSINPHINALFNSNGQIINLTFCNNGIESGRNQSMNLVMVDLFIDAYVMVRLMQILHKSSSFKNRSFNIFTLVTYWNLMTVLVALWYHMLMGLNNFEYSQSYDVIAKQASLIILSYLVTIETEKRR